MPRPVITSPQRNSVVDGSWRGSRDDGAGAAAAESLSPVAPAAASAVSMPAAATRKRRRFIARRRSTRSAAPMNPHLKNALKRLPGVRQLIAQRNQLLSERDRLLSDLLSLRRNWDQAQSELATTRELLYSTFTGFDYRLADLQREFAGLKHELETELKVLEASRTTLRAELLEARNRSEELQQKLAALESSWSALHADRE